MKDQKIMHCSECAFIRQKHEPGMKQMNHFSDVIGIKLIRNETF